jgi:hypothetical protein
MTVTPPETNTPAAQVGRLIRVQMTRTGRSTQDLAEAVDVSTSTLTRKIQGTIAWSLEDLIQVAVCLEVPLSAIVPDSLTED